MRLLCVKSFLALLSVVVIPCLASLPDFSEQGLDSNLEFRYEFEGRVSTGIGAAGGHRSDPDGGKALAGAAIKGFITVQRAYPSLYTIKLSELNVGSYHGDVECKGMGQMPVQYQPMDPQYGELLEQPFVFNAANPQSSWILDVPAADELWMTNFRKSFVFSLDAYLAPVLTGDEDVCVEQEEPVFPINVVEPRVSTIYGPCDARYSLEWSYDVESSLESDIQAPRFHGNKLPSGHIISPFDYQTTIKITRSIDFDSCDDFERPLLVKASSGNWSDFGEPKSGLSGEQRSSVSVYYVRGSPCKGYRIEMIQSESYLSQYPFSIKTEQLQVLTNQTIRLISVEPITETLRPVLPSRRISVLTHEVQSPYQESYAKDENPNWIRFLGESSLDSMPVFPEQTLTGAIPSNDRSYSQDVAQVLTLIRSSLSKILDRTTLLPVEDNKIGGSSMGVVASDLYSAQRIVSTLPKTAFQNIFDDTQPKEKSLLAHVMAASGSGPAVGYLLEMMMTSKGDSEDLFGTATRGSIMLLLADNLPDSSVVPALIDYIISVDLNDEPITGPSALVAATKVLHRLCAPKPIGQALSYSRQLYGNKRCPLHLVQDKLLDYIKEKIQDRSSTWLERITAVQMYATLGIGVEVSELFNIIAENFNPIVKATAVYALSKRYLTEENREDAISVLLSVVKNQNLSSDLRMSAVASLVSWSPDQLTWNDLAMLTRDPSSSLDVSHFIYATLNTVKNTRAASNTQATYAESALRLAKPMSVPYKPVNDFGFVSNDSDTQGSTRSHMSWLNTDLNSQFYLSLVGNSGNQDFNIFELIKHHVNLLQNDQDDHDGQRTKLMLKMADTDIFMPIQYTDYGIKKDSTHPLKDLIMQNFAACGTGGGIEAVQYYHASNSETFIPTEMGLPVLNKLIAPTIFYSKTSFNGSACHDDDNTYDIQLDAKFSSKVTSVVEVLVPWSSKKIAAGVDLERTVSLPVKLKGTYILSTTSGCLMKNKQRMSSRKLFKEQDNDMSCALLSVSVSSLDNTTTVPVLFRQTTPFTSIKSLSPTNYSLTHPQDLIVIREKATTPVKKTVQLTKHFTSINTTLSYEGDRSYPYTFFGAASLFMNPGKLLSVLATPSTRYTRTVVQVDPTTSTNDEAYLLFNAGTVTRPIDNSRTGSVFTVVLVAQASFSKRHMYDFETATTFSLDVIPPSTPALTSESILLLGSCHVNNYINAFMFPCYDHDAAGRALVITGSSVVPLLTNLEQLKHMLHAGLQINRTMEIQTEQVTIVNGSPHVETRIADTTILLNLSEPRRDYLKKTIPEECQPGDDEPKASCYGRAVFDQIRVNHTWHMPPSTFGKPWRQFITLVKDTSHALLYPVMTRYVPSDYSGMDTTVVVNRSLLDDRWTGSCEHCSPPWTMDGLKTCPFIYKNYMTLIKPVVNRNARQRKVSSVRRAPTEGKVCSTDNNIVRTFDGQTFTKVPTICYQLFVVDCSVNPAWYVFTTAPYQDQIRKSMPYFRYLNADFTVDVIVGGFGYLYINGETLVYDTTEVVPIMHPQTKQQIGECWFRGHTQSRGCTIYGEVTLESGHEGGRVTLLQQSPVCGVCGDGDGDQTNDNVGAHMCSYRNLSLMAASWTKGMSCPETPTLQAQLEQIKTIQNSDSCNRIQPPLPWDPELPPLPVIPSSSADFDQARIASVQEWIRHAARGQHEPQSRHRESL